ncbi:MAG: amino acid-binding protein [Methanobrevibacter sp.]|uniref:amino acid-binding protein n=1 Tax=Methanobrevibacter sp. TaxID=66852 RepID=UPI0025F18595|nr:amino acid-binding protein [Methanobrevibacter sp.]MBQ2613238.1 amino acid-binding protein [Methanobrevibacter sp.]MEE0025395.1 amino acid-binding protein [Methanobrevibacter sp.]
MATQISVFIENKEGRIKKAIDTLANAGVNIRALSVGDTTKYGILRLIVSDNETATKSLENDGFIVKESEVVVVAVPDKPNGLNSTLSILDDADINLEYIYAFVSSQPNEAIVAMKVEDTEKAIKVFEENNAKILKKEDLEKI